MKYELPSEHSLALVINGVMAQKLICTDEALKALVYGFLYNEGYIDTVSDVKELAFIADHSRAEVTLTESIKPNGVPQRLSGFGGVSLGGKAAIQKLPLKSLFGLGFVSSCAKEAEGLAVKYAQTGGMHCSALFNAKGLIMYYEDIGRHNTFDKIAGRCLIDRISAKDCMLVTTGRVSEDMVRKAANLGISLIASYTTATDKAVKAAEKLGMTIVAYACGEEIRVYCGEKRIV